MTTLSRCILLPPLSDTVDSHIDLPRKLLPHLIAVEKFQERIKKEFSRNQLSLRRLWPPTLVSSGIHSQKALRLAKTSLVFSQCGYFQEAEERQRVVMDFVCNIRGADHPRAMDITLALSGTLRQQARAAEAAELQQQVLQICLKTLGPTHSRTLKVMDALGESRRLEGRFTESIELHQTAIKGMESLLSEKDAALFHALGHLGVTLWYCFRYDEAKQHQERAVQGLKTILGPANLETLNAVEALAVTNLELGTKLLENNEEVGSQILSTAHRDMEFVMQERTKQLGEHQPYTWLAKCNLGRIKAAMGELTEGEDIIRSLLPIAAGHLGENHLGVLAGKSHLAKILIKQGRFTEAEDILTDISRPERYRSAGAAAGEHPDRFDALWNLTECYKRQDRFEDCLRICDELSTTVIRIRKARNQTDTSDTFLQMIRDRQAEIQSLANVTTVEVPTNSPEESSSTAGDTGTSHSELQALAAGIQTPANSSMLRQRGKRT